MVQISIHGIVVQILARWGISIVPAAIPGTAWTNGADQGKLLSSYYRNPNSWHIPQITFRERDFNNRDSSNSGPARYNRRSRSRSRSRERMRRGGYDDHRRDYGPDDDSRDTMRTNYSSSSSSYRNDRYRGRQDEHKSGGGGGGGFDRRFWPFLHSPEENSLLWLCAEISKCVRLIHSRDKGGYSRGYSPNNSYAHQNQNQGRDRNDCDEDYDSCERWHWN